MFYFLLFILGTAFGSFLNVVSIRYRPEKPFFRRENFLGRSGCLSCGKRLRIWELVPIFSWLWLRGRCGGCKEKIFWQYPLVEAAAGVLTAGAFYVVFNMYAVRWLWLGGEPVWGFLILAIGFVLVWYLLILVAVIDLRWKVIPNEINLMLFLLGILIITTHWFYGTFGLTSGSFAGQFASMFGLREGVWMNHLTAGLALAAFFLLIVVLSGGKGMGVGDVKLAGALGVIFGWPDSVIMVVVAFMLGAIYGIVLILRDKTRMKTTVPFGPWLVLGAGLTFFFGEAILAGYFGLFWG